MLFVVEDDDDDGLYSVRVVMLFVVEDDDDDGFGHRWLVGGGVASRSRRCE